MSRKFRESNPFWQRLSAQLDEQFKQQPLPDPPDAVPLKSLAPADESTVKAARLAIAQGKHLEKSHV